LALAFRFSRFFFFFLFQTSLEHPPPSPLEPQNTTTTTTKPTPTTTKTGGEAVELPQFRVSYKPQKISPKFEGTVRQLLHKRIREAYLHPQFVSDVMKPMNIDPLMDQEVQVLSGGELQRVAIALALGTPADIYLIDGEERRKRKRKGK